MDIDALQNKVFNWRNYWIGEMIMNEPIHSYMKIGTIAFMSYPETIKGEGDKIESSIKKY